MRKRVPKIFAVYQLINVETKETEELYTITNYDEYVNINTKKKYIRGKVTLYSNTGRTGHVSIENMPEVIDTNMNDWKVSRKGNNIRVDEMRLINAYASYRLLGH